jgi:hypothetical protein
LIKAKDGFKPGVEDEAEDEAEVCLRLPCPMSLFSSSPASRTLPCWCGLQAALFQDQGESTLSMVLGSDQLLFARADGYFSASFPAMCMPSADVAAVLYYLIAQSVLIAMDTEML